MKDKSGWGFTVKQDATAIVKVSVPSLTVEMEETAYTAPLHCPMKQELGRTCNRSLAAGGGRRGLTLSPHSHHEGDSLCV